MLTVTQFLIWWRHIETHITEQYLAASACTIQSIGAESKQVAQINAGEDELYCELEQHLIQQKYYLRANLNVADLARALSVTEYRISVVVRQRFDAQNFNQLINQLRVEYSKSLLSDRRKDHWTILVIGIESGFASVGPFTRAY